MERERHSVRDPHDQVFLDLAVAAAMPVLVSGDADLLEHQHTVKPLLILSPRDFRTWLGRAGEMLLSQFRDVE